ncbi:MAG: radical SAM protein [Oscillospiraceae bacterium]|nr:radical SAM protein [Oscillospiraceae bacterium]
MELHYFQKGFNYSQDGPGNRLVYHLQGCNLRCRWCSNPEGWEAGASCTAESVPDMVAYAKSCEAMFFDGGGVTLTGGEPTQQFEAVKAFFTGLKAAGIRTALETNGTHRHIEELFPLVDSWMMDFKHYDSALHKEYIGAGNEQIKDSFRKAAAAHKPLDARILLIPHFNADVKHIPGFLEFFKSIDTSNMTFEFLIYHEFGKDKWKKAGMLYDMPHEFVPKETLAAFQNAFIENGFHLIHT